MLKVSENTLKWLMRLYPPLLFQRIWVKRFHEDFRGVDVKIVKSIWNMNSNKTIFGGTRFPDKACNLSESGLDYIR